ncbi:MAG: twin-arginine translocase subunit TatC [Candidatus Solibacter usitatus]|nr:twin-arginine translocase subunit TatC [Candidatus Solibacter usitatus]
MLRMSFLEHLEELRTRLIRSVLGLAVAFILSLTFSGPLWKIVSAPARAALTQLGVVPPKLAQTGPMEVFSIVWMKMPLLTAIFLGSPWILYQIWSFIAPGLYKKERRLAAPFILTSAGLFILGGVFAYFVAFRFGLVFLLGIGRDPDVDVQTLITVTDYFDLFVNVMLGVSLVFELPVVIFFLTLLRIASPRWLMSNARYAILGIVVLAAIITPTPDIFNMLLFAVPMVGLFFVGVLASYILVLNREGQKFPWGKVLLSLLAVLLLAAGGIWLAITKYGYHLIQTWPFLTR